jgi:hypothetical protein
MSELNENHKRTLMIGFRYVDDLLSDIENIMSTPVHPLSPFEKHVADITPEQRKIIAAEITLARAMMCRILESKGIKIRHPEISAANAVRTAIHFADIAMEEKRPKYMKGYGELTEEAKRELDEVVAEMKKPLEQILKALR